MIHALIPPDAVAAETFGDLPEPLFPDEVLALLRAVDKRRREFRTVRGCARRALAELGLQRAPMVPGQGGMPPWPAGVVGSLTHCDGYRAAVVARVERVAVLGIDAEPHEPLPAGILELVSLPSERDQLRSLTQENPEVAWDRLLFCAKEAVYKAWFPRARRWLGFEDAHVTLASTDEAGGTFDVELVHPPDQQAFGLGLALRGRWRTQHGLLLAVLSADT